MGNKLAFGIDTADEAKINPSGSKGCGMSIRISWIPRI